MPPMLAMKAAPRPCSLLLLAAAPGPAYLPAGHTSHTALPASAANVPGRHGLGSAEPTEQLPRHRLRVLAAAVVLALLDALQERGGAQRAARVRALGEEGAGAQADQR